MDKINCLVKSLNECLCYFITFLLKTEVSIAIAPIQVTITLTTFEFYIKMVLSFIVSFLMKEYMVKAYFSCSV